jgi:hypothetical protein
VPPLQGVAAFLERAKQEAADKGEVTEQDGEFTHAEQTKREMRREERRKKHEEARKRGEAECESCRESAGEGLEVGARGNEGSACSTAQLPCRLRLRSALTPATVNPAKDPEAIGDPFTTLFLSRLVSAAQRGRADSVLTSCAAL